MIKAGLLGLGTIGMVHYQDGYQKIMENNGPVSLEACFDISEDNLAKADGVRKYTDLDAFFENEKGKLDMIDICLPTFMHKEVSIKAMQHGFNVLCEKPMSLNYEDTLEMCNASKETGKKLMVAQTLRFARDYNLIKEYVETEKLGKLRNISCFEHCQGLPGGHNNWFQQANLSGGPILDIHVHLTDWFIWMFKEPEYLTTISTEKTSGQGYKSISSTYVYKDFYAKIDCDWAVPSNQHSLGRNIRINFENGYVLKNYEMFVEVDKDGNITDLTEKNPKYGSYANEIIYFAKAIENNTQVNVCLPESSALSIKLVEAEIKSADNGGKFVYCK